MLRHRSRPFSGLFSSRTPRHTRKPSSLRGRRLWVVEGLENRVMLAATVYTVNATTDTGAGSGTTGDLLYCIDQANANPNTAGSVIEFDPTVFGTSQTITLSSTLRLSETAGPEVIKGPGANLLTVSGNNAVGVFSVNTGVTATITGQTISQGLATQGGGISDFEGTVTVSNSTIANNSAAVGGGISDIDGTLTVTDSTLVNDSAGSGGGIFDNESTLTVSNSTIDENSADSGGGIYNSGSLTVSNSTISNNSAGSSGGGLFNGANQEYSSVATVSDSTIAYNTVSSGGSGGGLDTSAGTATLNNTIVAQNTNGTGSGATPDDIALQGGAEVSSSSAYNLIGTGGSGGLTNGVNGNQVGVADPGLGTLASNGGPTQTIALLAGSPAINAGSNALAVDPTTGQPLKYDQRGPGFPRIIFNTVNIGAFEYNGISLVVTTQPPASVTAGTSFGLTVTAENTSGNVDTSFNGTVAVALTNNPGGATLGGTLTATAQNGVASFSDLTLDKVGVGYTLFVSTSSVGGATTDAFDVTPAAATQLILTSQPPSDVVAGSPFGLTVAAEDPYGNVDTNFVGSMTVGLKANPSGATLGGTLSATAQAGVATFSDLTIDQVGIGYTLQVSSDDLNDATTNAFEVTVPTVYMVNATTDTGAGSGTTGDLLYCIDQANANPNTAGSVIQFDPTVFGTPQVIALSSTLNLSETAGPEVISGPGASLATVSGNDAVGVFSVSSGVTAMLSGLTIAFGRANDGGGIVNHGTLTVSNSTIVHNSASTDGGGMFSDGNTMSVSNCIIAFDSAVGNGGGILNESGSTLTVSNSTISNNSASSEGGGIDNSGNTATVSNSTIANDSAGDGGGIMAFYGGGAVVSSSTFIHDSAQSTGGGIFAYETSLTVSGSAITYDSAGDYGGGIFNFAATMTVFNSTIGYDSAGDDGGGISNDGALTATNDTIAYNTVGEGGGGLDLETGGGSNGTAILSNTIIALNTLGTGGSASPNDIFLNGGSVQSSSAYNLIGTGGSGGLINGVNGNQVGVADPGLGTLASNGGPTQTIALLAGSPAINAGSNALAVDPLTGQPLTTDQRGTGFVRIFNGTVDIGAYEVQPYLVVTTQPPASVTAGSDFGLAVTVDYSSGNVDTSYNGTVTVALSNNPGGATLGGTLTVAVQSGVATFSGLTLDTTGTGYTLLASSSSLPTTTTSAFNVTPAATSQLVLTQSPASAAVGAEFPLVVAAEDQYGNLATTFGGSVAVALLNNPGGATLGGTLALTAQGGVATFSGLTLNEVGTGYTLQVSSTGLTAATTQPFNVTAVGNIYTVNSLGDTGTGSGLSGDLRYVITQADSNAGSTIVFGVTGTISLASALPDLVSDVTINGPGTAELTVARSSAAGTTDFRIFTIDTNTKVKIVGLTITGGAATQGGGLLDNGGAVSLTNVTVINNQAVGADGAAGSAGGQSGPGGDGGSGQGGGLYLAGGSLTLNDDLIASNAARGGAGGAGGLGSSGESGGAGGSGGLAAGGGIYASDGALVLNNDVFESNQAIGGAGGNGGFGGGGALSVPGGAGGAGGAGGLAAGGGIYASDGALVLNNDVFESNQAIGGAGGNGGFGGGGALSVPGGAGGAGGAGGLAAGGGIYASDGALVLNNDVFESNQAIGGAGGNGGFGGGGASSAPGGAGGVGGVGNSAAGGAIYLAQGNLTLTTTTLNNNAAIGGAGGAGGNGGRGGTGEAGRQGTRGSAFSGGAGQPGNNGALGGRGGQGGNAAAGYGGGIYLLDGTVTLSQVNLGNNSARGGGWSWWHGWCRWGRRCRWQWGTISYRYPGPGCSWRLGGPWWRGWYRWPRW